MCRGDCTPAGGITECRRTTRVREGPSDTAYRRETCIRPPARGKRKSPKRFCPLPFVLIVDTEGGWGKMSSRFPRGENENLMRNKLRALNWFGQTLSDDLWDFASKQCAFNPNCGKTTVHPVRPRLMQRRVGSSHPSVARERDRLGERQQTRHGQSSCFPDRRRRTCRLFLRRPVRVNPPRSTARRENHGVVIDGLSHEATAQDISCVRG